MFRWTAYGGHVFPCLLVTALFLLSWYIFSVTDRIIVFPPPGPRAKPESHHQIIIVDWTGYNMNSKGADIHLDNCLVTRSRHNVSLADAVVVTSRRTGKMSNLPPSSYRNHSQRWIWLMDENPFHINLFQSFKVHELDGLFNWTMTYRRDSDVYIPYGVTRTKANLADTSDIPVNIGKQQELVIAVISNCVYIHNGRLDYVRELNKTVPVTLLGDCGERKCAGFNLVRRIQQTGCPEAENYLFYLAFENSNCKDYVSEKSFLNAMSYGAVPVVMGPPRGDYDAIMPSNSFIHVADFNSTAALGSYLIYLSKNRQEYMQYHDWRRTQYVETRLQYYDDNIWSPLCDKLKTAPATVKIAPPLEKWFNPANDCTP